jgi:hypothetical protein
VPDLLAIEFLNHDQRQNHLVLIETKNRVRIGENDTGVKDVRAGHGVWASSGVTLDSKLAPDGYYKDPVGEQS